VNLKLTQSFLEGFFWNKGPNAQALRQAAMALVANALLNLDEFLTKPNMNATRKLLQRILGQQKLQKSNAETFLLMDCVSKVVSVLAMTALLFLVIPGITFIPRAHLSDRGS